LDFDFARGKMEKGGFVYILSSKGKRLYTGVTSQLWVRVNQHKEKKSPTSFTARYNIDQLVYYEIFGTIEGAIAREKAIKDMHRIAKIRMIVSVNPTWRDLSEDWGKATPPFEESKLRPPATFPQAQGKYGDSEPAAQNDELNAGLERRA
jgi:putative endonuclease